MSSIPDELDRTPNQDDNPHESLRREGGDWPGYKRLVLADMKRLGDGLEALRIQQAVFHEANQKEIHAIREEISSKWTERLATISVEFNEKLAKVRTSIAVLQTKAAMWGAVAGIVAGAIVVALAGKFIHP